MSPRYPISIEGGRVPRWSGDGRELFYVTGDSIVSVDVRTDGEFRTSSPRREIELPALRNFDVSPEGDRLLVVQENVDELPTDVHVVLNWHQELLRLVPVK